MQSISRASFSVIGSAHIRPRLTPRTTGLDGGDAFELLFPKCFPFALKLSHPLALIGAAGSGFGRAPESITTTQKTHESIR
jgi:hypothetical protein